jgi:tetratricopeptide (TPR) repeat protein
VEDAIRQSIQEYPARQIFRCALILLLCDLQREPAAQAALDQLAANAFADISFDNDWLLCMSFLADAIEHLADAARAATLYDLVLPYAALNGSNADEISVGAMARSLGNAAHAMGRWDDSEAHFEAALEANARMGAIPWVARTQRDYARMLRARGGPGDDERAELLASTPAL